MTIVGIAMSHDGSLSVVKNGRNIFSIGEERLNRVKAYIGFPFESLRYIVNNNIVNPKEVDVIAIGTHSVFPFREKEVFAFVLNEEKKYYDIQNEDKPKDFFIKESSWENISTDSECKAYVSSKIKELCNELGMNPRVEFVEHHLSHTASAYCSSGFNECLSITMDAYGDGLSATVSICKNGKIERIHEEPFYQSLGNFYSEVTFYSGFKRSRHEGKITGLAAHGNASKFSKILDACFKVKDGKISIGLQDNRTISKIVRTTKNLISNKPIGILQQIIKDLEPISKEDLAACAQYVAEEKAKDFAKYWLSKTGQKNLVLAGGLFANVRVNQELSEIQGVENLFIHQNMGDGGNAFGAAIYEYYQQNEFKPEQNFYEQVYFGPEYTNDTIEESLSKHKEIISYSKSENVALETAQLVHENQIVGWFQGKMEYGPRALGNRTILASPVDKNINDWLNKRLKRTEFMPFAPSCLYEFAEDVFVIPNPNIKFPALFMTITFDMKDEWIKKAPAVAHIDGTARPQLVTETSNLKYYQLLKAYHQVSGLPLLINTSFNVHEEPIVCSPEDAIKPLLSGVIDYLVIGDFICKRK